MACSTQIFSDLYLSSLQSMSMELLSANYDMVQFSIPIFLSGICSSLLFFGPIAETIGRKKTIMISIYIMLLGSFMCFLTDHITLLLIGRLIQGVGGGGLAGLWRAILRDSMSGSELAAKSSFISIFMIFTTTISPAIGSQIQIWLGWRYNFLFMILFLFLMLFVIILGYEQPKVHTANKRATIHEIKTNYLTLLKSRIFTPIAITSLLCYGAMFSWIVQSPHLLMTRQGFTEEQFGLAITLSSLASMTPGVMLNAYFVKRYKISSMLKMGWFLVGCAGLLLCLNPQAILNGYLSIIIPVMLFYFATAFIWSNAFAIAFTPFGHLSSYASALYGFLQLIGGAGIASLVAFLPETDQTHLGLIMITSALASYLLYHQLVRPEITND